MSKYRKRLPQLGDDLFLTDSGLETTLIFHDGLALPCFAAFDLLRGEAGTEVLRRYFERYAQIAREQERGLVLETPTWRANPDWAAKLGYDAAAWRTQPALGRAPARDPQRVREPRTPIVKRQPRTARRRVCPGAQMSSGGPGVSRAAGGALRGDRRGHGGGVHHELPRGSDRHRAGGTRGRDAGGHLVHDRDGWPAPVGAPARRCHRVYR